MICGLPKKSRHCDGFGFDSYLSMTRERFSFAIVPSASHITSGMQSGTVTEGEGSESPEGAPVAKAGDDDDGGESDGEPARPRPRKTSRRVAAPLPCATAQPKAAKADNLPPQVPHGTPPTAWQPPAHNIPPLLRLPEVLRLVPVSRSSWYDGMKDGRYPSPVKLGPRAVAWRSADILALTV